MATIRRLRLCRTDAAGTQETVHFETSSEIVLRPDGTTVEAALKAGTGGGTVTQETLAEAIKEYFTGTGSSGSSGAEGKSVIETIVKEYLANVAAGKGDGAAATQKAVEDIVKKYFAAVASGTGSAADVAAAKEFTDAVQKVLDDGEYATEDFVTTADTALRKELVDKINSGVRISDPKPFTVVPGAWKTDSYPTYSYYYDIPDDTVTGDDIATMQVDAASAPVAQACGMAPVTETLAKVIRIRASSAPTANISGEYRIEYHHALEEASA